jgi:hypothetical protein
MGRTLSAAVRAQAACQLRGFVWVGLAVLAVASVGAAYLRPNLAALAPHRPAPAATPPAPRPIAVAFVDAQHGVVFIDRTEPPAGGSTVLLTQDGGRTWKGLPAGAFPYLGLWFAGGRLLLVVLDQPAGGSLAGPPVDLSDDGGETWRPVQLPGANLPASVDIARTMTFADHRNGFLLVTTSASASTPRGAAFWRTSDGGSTWSPLPASGLFASPVLGMTFPDTEHGVLAVEGPDGAPLLLATQDGGASWRQAAALDVSQPGPPSDVSLISEGTRVLAVLDYVTPSGPDGGAALHVYTAVSNDAGGTWTGSRPGPVSRQVRGQFAGPESRTGDLLALLDGIRLWTSTDGGATWAVRTAQFPARLVPHPPVSGDRHAMFVLASSSWEPSGEPVPGAALVVLRSVDGGAHWKPLALQVPRGR